MERELAEDSPYRPVGGPTAYYKVRIEVWCDWNEQYLLDSQKKAKNYKGKDVEVTGTLDKEKHLIHVEKIKVAPSM